MATTVVQAVNACTFCKRGKRKCSKDRPSCSNCLRLGKPCMYTEDTFETSFVDSQSQSPNLEELKRPRLALPDSLSGIDPSNHASLQISTVDMAVRTFGSVSNIGAISQDFFTGTHQRISALSKLRFGQSLELLTTAPRADFAALCLSILLLQQTSIEKKANMQSSLYYNVKNLITLLETKLDPSLDLVHCRILVTFYEMGHGLHRAAYISLATCARVARLLGLHRKRWLNLNAESDRVLLEEEKRTWWAIVVMDRFINLCYGDASFITDDPARKDSLPIEDLSWSESYNRADLEGLINAAPLLDTPFDMRVGQLARECQISHLAGHVLRHAFDPISDPRFDTEEAFQLERTLKAYVPLLSNEELKIGKYCGAFGICNSALFVLYEYMLSRNPESFDRQRVLKSIEETALGALTFAEASYSDREGNYPYDIFSPYLPYSLYQAAIVFHRLWMQSRLLTYRQYLETLKSIIRDFTKRWMVAWQYLEAIEQLDESGRSFGVPGMEA